MKEKVFLALRIILFYGGVLLGIVWNQISDSPYLTMVIIFISVFTISSISSNIVLEKVAPKGLEARKVSVRDSRRVREDKILLPLYSGVAWLSIIVIPLDKFYWQIFNQMNFFWSKVGITFIILSFIISGLSIYSNPYITRTIHDQSKERQKVISTGIYSVVRHPFYTSITIQLIGTSLWFSSTMSFLVAIVALLILIIRINVEEATLKKNLSGYQDYMKSTKYRLIPHIW